MDGGVTGLEEKLDSGMRQVMKSEVRQGRKATGICSWIRRRRVEDATGVKFVVECWGVEECEPDAYGRRTPFHPGRPREI